MYVIMYICMYASMRLCISVFVYVCVYVSTYAYISICAWMYVCAGMRGLSSSAADSERLSHLSQGLKILHLNHVVHRDVKLGNILVNSRGSVKVRVLETIGSVDWFFVCCTEGHRLRNLQKSRRFPDSLGLLRGSSWLDPATLPDPSQKARFVTPSWAQPPTCLQSASWGRMGDVVGSAGCSNACLC